MRKRTVSIIATLVAALATAAGTQGSAAAQSRAQSQAQSRPAPLVVPTDKGFVQGMEAGGAREFLGIPYAAPPVGPLRWRPPQPVRGWRGIREATSPGNVCAQIGTVVTGELNTSTAEDCLYLNVYTPPVLPRAARCR